MKEKNGISRYFTNQMVMIAFGLAAVYWISSPSCISSLPPTLTFSSGFFGSNIGGIWTRLINFLCLFALFGPMPQHTISTSGIRGAQAEERYRTIIESIEDVYLTETASYKSMPRFLGYGEENCIGENLLDSMDEENAGKVINMFNTVKQASGLGRDRQKRRQAGRESVCFAHQRPLTSRRLQGYFARCDQAKRIRNVQQAKIAAEAASRSKSFFCQHEPTKSMLLRSSNW